MPKRILQAKKVVKVLCKEFRFIKISQKGSHIKLRKITSFGRKIITIVPLHKELAYGTLKGVLELAKIEEEDFFNMFKKVKKRR